MALVAVSIPNLISGVSQQPHTLRLASSCSELINGWPSVVTGLSKRPPTQHVAKLTFAGGVPDDTVSYMIDRGNGYQFSVIISNGDLKVYNFDGTEQTVTFPDGKAYLNSAKPNDNFRFVTLADTTFILNRGVITGKDSYGELVSPVRPNPNGTASVHVTNSIANTYYAIYLNNVLAASYLTPNGTDAANAVPGTDQIATSLGTALSASGFPPAVYGSTITFAVPAGTAVMSVAGQGDHALKSYTLAVNQFSDLPPNEAPGRIVQVKGSLKDNGDDYYVQYIAGIWEETNGYASGERPDAATMPHVLQRNPDGTWTFKKHVWENRFVGDAVSNPSPTFLGTWIQDIFLYNGRLGFLANENVCLSEANNLEQFYRTTMPTVVDDDPIDIAVLNTGNDQLYHAVPFNKDLLLMSDRNQHKLSYQNYLGPKSLTIQFATSYNVSRTVKPVNIGSSVYFADDHSSYNFAKVWEFYTKDNQTGDDAEDATAPVPEYIKSGIKFMTASPRMKCVVLNSDKEPNKLYLYKFYWAANRKVQNAWSTWTFDDCEAIQWAGFTQSELYILLKRNGDLFLEKMKLDETVTRSAVDSRILLDRQVQKDKLTLSYDSLNDRTTITLPYATPFDVEVVTSDFDSDPEVQVKDLRNVVTKVNSTTVRVPGDITAHELVTCGIGYTLLYRFSQPYLRQPKGTGEVVVLDGVRLQLRYMTIEYHDTAYFTAKLSYPGREDVITTFDGKITGDASFVVGETPFVSGKVRIPLVGNNKDITFELQNDSPYNCSFGAAEWTCIHSPRAKVRM